MVQEMLLSNFVKKILLKCAIVFWFCFIFLSFSVLNDLCWPTKNLDPANGLHGISPQTKKRF